MQSKPREPVYYCIDRQAVKCSCGLQIVGLAMEKMQSSVSGSECSDEDLMRQVAAQQQDAIAPLYARYASLIFHLAAHTLDSAAAEDIVQDVFLSVWHKAATFDPQRGAFRPWLLQIAHYRILNELRRRSRRPPVDVDTSDDFLEAVPDANGEPFDAAWNTFRRDALRAAVEQLPPKQRQALSLAFFEDLTHDQVASMLQLPLGTVKTRIRSAVHALRMNMAVLALVAVLAGAATLAGIAYELQQATLQRNQRALALVTVSNITLIHLPAAPGVDPATHGSYRGRPGVPLAVVALEKFPPLAQGKIYQGWVLHQGTWLSLGAISPDADGSGVLIGEEPGLSDPPEAIEVTLEPGGGSAAPGGPVIIVWPGQ